MLLDVGVAIGTRYVVQCESSTRTHTRRQMKTTTRRFRSLEHLLSEKTFQNWNEIQCGDYYTPKSLPIFTIISAQFPICAKSFFNLCFQFLRIVGVPLSTPSLSFSFVQSGIRKLCGVCTLWVSSVMLRATDCVNLFLSVIFRNVPYTIHTANGSIVCVSASQWPLFRSSFTRNQFQVVWTENNLPKIHFNSMLITLSVVVIVNLNNETTARRVSRMWYLLSD